MGVCFGKTRRNQRLRLQKRKAQVEITNKAKPFLDLKSSIKASDRRLSQSALTDSQHLDMISKVTLSVVVDVEALHDYEFPLALTPDEVHSSSNLPSIRVDKSSKWTDDLLQKVVTD